MNWKAAIEVWLTGGFMILILLMIGVCMSIAMALAEAFPGYAIPAFIVILIFVLGLAVGWQK